MIEELQRWLRGKASLVLNVERLRSFSASLWPVELGTTHGVEHWDRVARFGTMLYREGADMDVILAATVDRGLHLTVSAPPFS